jgi:DNA invertase Pin-like site-specific DNA recombinase
MLYPKWLYHPLREPRMVKSRDEEIALGEGWGNVDEYRARLREGTRLAAIYARMGPEEQKSDVQLTELRAYVARMGWQAIEYLETESSAQRRPVFDRMMADAKLRKFSVVLVCKVDCFPLGMKQLVDTVLELDKCGIYFRAVSQNLSSDQKDPMGQCLLKLFAILAQQEHAIMVERVRAGMMEANRQGKHCGRPGRVWRREPAVELRAKGWSWRRIAKHLKVPVTSVRRAVQQSQDTS